jgi:hypothetical protein
VFVADPTPSSSSCPAYLLKYFISEIAYIFTSLYSLLSTLITCIASYWVLFSCVRLNSGSKITCQPRNFHFWQRASLLAPLISLGNSYAYHGFEMFSLQTTQSICPFNTSTLVTHQMLIAMPAPTFTAGFWIILPTIGYERLNSRSPKYFHFHRYP